MSNKKGGGRKETGRAVEDCSLKQGMNRAGGRVVSAVRASALGCTLEEGPGMRGPLQSEEGSQQGPFLPADLCWVRCLSLCFK